jgi:3-oxosteroid 1-dehydrogenase
MAVQWDESYDLVIVGSGGGSMVAALAANACGKSVIIIEKQPVVGGSTAYSGGILWIPNNPYMVTPDSPEKARTYLDNLIGDVGPASSPARRKAFITEGSNMLRFLGGLGLKFKDAFWPDYYSDEPGGVAFGRSIVPRLFNMSRLGDWESRLGRSAHMRGLPIGSEEVCTLSLVKRTWRGKVMALRVLSRVLVEKITKIRLRGAGNSLQGHMLEMTLRAKIPIKTNAPVVSIVSDNGSVTGVVIRQGGRDLHIKANAGVLLNSGGFSHNLSMREQYQPKPATTKWTLSNPGDTGEVIKMAMDLGAKIDLMNESWWVPCSFEASGKLMGFNVPSDLGKPHAIAVNRHGRRFGNEAGAYMEFGQRMYANEGVPAWAIIESRHRRNYMWGMLPPGQPKPAQIESGYFKKADTLTDLAKQCGIEPGNLESTVARFNTFCERGVDEDFGKGSTVYNRYNGDPTIKPNACLGKIERAPFYAVAIQAADVGTAGGLLTDEHARVLRTDGSVIPGLYAAGNCSASVLGRVYPGAGASIAAAFVFGYIAARHICGGSAV